MNPITTRLAVILAMALALPTLAHAAGSTAKKRIKSAHSAPVPLAPADAAQREAAKLAYYGDYACEFSQTISVSPNPKSEGYVDLRFKKNTWTMKPVLSPTGALRLEDVKGRMLLVQIAKKSMLMDTKIGQRVVDECASEKQRIAAL